MSVQIALGLGSGVLSTMFMTLGIRGLPREQQATAMGVFQAIYAIGMLAGPIVSGLLGSNRGLSDVFFLAGSVGLLIAALALLPIFSRSNLH